MKIGPYLCGNEVLYFLHLLFYCFHPETNCRGVSVCNYHGVCVMGKHETREKLVLIVELLTSARQYDALHVYIYYFNTLELTY